MNALEKSTFPENGPVLSKNRVEAATAGLGQRVHQRRKELALSLRDLAHQSGLTASFLSQFERGRSSASLESMQKICSVLDLPFLDLLGEEGGLKSLAQKSPGIRPYSPVVRACQRARVSFPNISVLFELLTSSPAWKMEAFYNHLDAGCSTLVRHLRQPTEELLFVISGELTVELDEGTYTLGEQDALYFEGPQLQRLANLSTVECTWLSMITPAVF